MYLRKPESEERKRAILYYGDKTSAQVFRAYYFYRQMHSQEHKQKGFISKINLHIKKLNQDVRKDIEAIKEKHVNVITRYPFPMNNLIEDTFIGFL